MFLIRTNLDEKNMIFVFFKRDITLTDFFRDTYFQRSQTCVSETDATGLKDFLTDLMVIKNFSNVSRRSQTHKFDSIDCH